MEAAPVQIVYREEDVAAILKQRRTFISEAWGLAAAYDTAITIAGYGAFFALWSGVAADVTPVARTTTAALMGISVLTYVAWSVLLMLARHWHDRKLGQVMLQSEPPSEQLMKWEKVELQRRDALITLQHRLWMPIFGTSLTTGVAGAGVLIYNCVAVATGLPQLTGKF